MDWRVFAVVEVVEVFGGVGWCLEVVGRVKSCLEWLVASNI